MTKKSGSPELADEELLIALANTDHGELDELAEARTMRAWWRGLGRPTGGQRIRPDTPDGLAMVRSLRALIRGLALRNNGIETDLDPAALDGLTLHPDLRGRPTLRAAAPSELADDICAAAVTAVLRATARPSWPRLKACRGEDCRFVFLDSSRNTSRRWCEMAGCGNRAKSAAFRVRRRASETVA